MPTRPGTEAQPLWQKLIGAFAGLLIGAVVIGVLYSTIVSFFVIKTQKGRSYT
jgi:hypothetical protein